MAEKMEFTNANSNIEEIQQKLRKEFLGKIKSLRDYSAICKEFFEKTGISLKILQKDSANFEENRSKLNTEPGVVISNNPSLFDVTAVSSLITRDDVLAISNEAHLWKGTTLEKNYIETPHEPYKIKKAFTLAKEHIKNGGLFRLFPSGGEENSTGIFKFKSGFKNMLLDGSLDKDTMIYCFNVKGQSTQMSFEEKGEYRKKYFAYFFLKAANQDTTVLGELPPLEIILDEKYTKAEEWMSVLEKNPQDPNTALTEHYLELFK